MNNCLQNTVQEVSIFEFLINEDIPGGEARSAFAKCAIKHLKTLKHPHFLSYLESSEVKQHLLPHLKIFFIKLLDLYIIIYLHFYWFLHV